MKSNFDGYDFANMERNYFVTYAINQYDGLHIGNIEITTLEMRVKNMSPGELAKYLQQEVEDTLAAESYMDVSIINYWEL